MFLPMAPSWPLIFPTIDLLFPYEGSYSVYIILEPIDIKRKLVVLHQRHLWYRKRIPKYEI